MNQTAQRWVHNRWFSALLLTAFICRALVPVGYMPGVGANGRFTVMLCPAYAPTLALRHDAAQPGDTVAMADMPGMSGMVGMAGMAGTPNTGSSPEHRDSHSPHQAQGTCSYAGAATGMAPLQRAPTLQLPERASLAVVFPPEQYIPRGTIVPNRLPRAPPSAV